MFSTWTYICTTYIFRGWITFAGSIFSTDSGAGYISVLIGFSTLHTNVHFHSSDFNRSTQRRYSVRKGVFRNFAKFTGRHLCQRDSETEHRCFSVDFAKFLRTPFFTEHILVPASGFKQIRLRNFHWQTWRCTHNEWQYIAHSVGGKV